MKEQEELNDKEARMEAPVEEPVEQAEETAPQEETDAEKLQKAEEQIAALKDQYLRQVAEFDNFRKRTIKEKTELILNGGEKVISALLPVLDDLERAQENISKTNEIETLKEGVDLILSKLAKTLEQQGLKKMDTANQSFDTDFHEAVALVPVQEETQKQQIIDCVQAGYMLNDKVIRHAKVVIGQ